MGPDRGDGGEGAGSCGLGIGCEGAGAKGRETGAKAEGEGARGERGGACRQEESSVIAGLIGKVSESSMSERVHPPLLA